MNLDHIKKYPIFQIFQNLKFENYNFYLENHDRSRTPKKSEKLRISKFENYNRAKP